MSRGVDLFVFFVSAGIAALLRELGKYLFGAWTTRLGLFPECANDDGALCIGNQVVYRIGASLNGYFLLTWATTLLVMQRTSCCFSVFFQIPFYLVLLVGSMLVPDAFFDRYEQVARIASAVFIVFQLIILVDSAYQLRDWLLDQIEQAEKDDEARQALLDANYETVPEKSNAQFLWEVAFLTIVGVCVVLSAIGIGYMYRYYGGCSLNLVFVTITMLACVVITFLSVSSWVDAGMLPSSVVSIYLVFMCWQALLANPDATCSASAVASSWGVKSPAAVTNTLIAAFTITWTSWRTSSAQTFLLSLSPSTSSKNANKEHELLSSNDKEPLIDKDPERGHNEEALSSTSDGVPKVPEYQFHVVMFFAAFYMVMIVTNWGSTEMGTSVQDDLVKMWVKVISEWAAAALFTWTLIAPSIFVDRDFDPY